MNIDTDPISAPEKKIPVLNTMHEVIEALRAAKAEMNQHYGGSAFNSLVEAVVARVDTK